MIADDRVRHAVAALARPFPAPSATQAAFARALHSGPDALMNQAKQSDVSPGLAQRRSGLRTAAPQSVPNWVRHRMWAKTVSPASLRIRTGSAICGRR